MPKENGHVPDLATEDLTPIKARAILETEAQAKSQQFNDGLVSLARETGYGVAPAIIYPSGEIVLLASYLKAHNIQLQPTIQIVKTNG